MSSRMPDPQRVIVNSGPIIALSGIGQLDLLRRLHERGTAGLLVAAKRRGFVPELRPILDAMREHGYYLSERLVAWICREVGE